MDNNGLPRSALTPLPSRAAARVATGSAVADGVGPRPTPTQTPPVASVVDAASRFEMLDRWGAFSSPWSPATQRLFHRWGDCGWHKHRAHGAVQCGMSTAARNVDHFTEEHCCKRDCNKERSTLPPGCVTLLFSDTRTCQHWASPLTRLVAPGGCPLALHTPLHRPLFSPLCNNDFFPGCEPFDLHGACLEQPHLRHSAHPRKAVASACSLASHPCEESRSVQRREDGWGVHWKQR